MTERKRNYEELLGGMFDLLLRGDGAIVQHTEKYGARDTYDLCCELGNVWRKVRDICLDSSRIEIRELGESMDDYTARVTEILDQQFKELFVKAPTISMEDLEALCEERKAS